MGLVEGDVRLVAQAFDGLARCDSTIHVFEGNHRVVEGERAFDVFVLEYE
jgi:hypothetical protein